MGIYNIYIYIYVEEDFMQMVLVVCVFDGETFCYLALGARDSTLLSSLSVR